MSDAAYAAIMLVVIGGIALVGVASMFSKKCSECGTRNRLDARECRNCKTPFPEEKA